MRDNRVPGVAAGPTEDRATPNRARPTDRQPDDLRRARPSAAGAGRAAPRRSAGHSALPQGPARSDGNGRVRRERPITTRRQRHAAHRRARASRRTLVGRHPFATGALVVLVGLTPVWVSLGSALTDPGLGVSISARFAEWAREHGGGSAVSWAENLWYAHHQPPVGGNLKAGTIPDPTKTGFATAAAGLPAPVAIAPLASPPIAGEGQWHPVGRKVNGSSAVYEAFLRPDAIHTSLVVGVAWMDTKLLRATLYSGSTIPGGGPYPDTAPITPTAATSLVAAFNAGFLMSNANGGYYTDGRTVVPLRSGAASFVVYRNGSATVAKWGRDATMASNVVAVRQNLDLLVDNGRPVAGLNANDTSVWGYTVGNQVYVWRSGLGVTANGALVYVGGPGLNVTSLANLLVRAGAVRAMELDINTDWVNFASFAPPSAKGLASAANGTDLLGDMAGTPGRYFASWWTRDFITVSARNS